MNKATLFLLFFSLLIFIHCQQPLPETDIIARVGDASLSIRELSEEIPQQLQTSAKQTEIKEYVIRWINKEVLYQEALSLKLDQRPDFQKELARLKRELLINELLELAIDRNPINISDAEIQKVYDQNDEDFLLNDDVVRCYHILCSTREEAESIRSRLAQGVPFEEVVKTMNPDSLQFKNWDVGYFTKEQIIPEISKEVFSLPVGAYSSAIKSDFGYHILKVIDKRSKGQKRHLSDVKEEIRMRLTELKRQEYYERYLLQTKSKYQIHSNFQLLDAMTSDSLVSAKKGE